MRFFAFCSLFFLSLSLLAADLFSNKRSRPEPELSRFDLLIIAACQAERAESVESAESKYSGNKRRKRAKASVKDRRICGLRDNAECLHPFGENGQGLIVHQIRDHRLCVPACFVLEEKWIELQGPKNYQCPTMSPAKNAQRIFAKQNFAVASAKKYPFLSKPKDKANYKSHRCNELYCEELFLSYEEKSKHEMIHEGPKVYFCGNCFMVFNTKNRGRDKSSCLRHLANGKNGSCNSWGEAYRFQLDDIRRSPEHDDLPCEEE